LKKYRGNPPSLIIHMHPTHFRFDKQEGSFSYKSPMRIMIDHLKLRTIPHDLSDFFAVSNVPFYEGCMIVQVYDHKTTAPSQGSNRANTGSGKTAPFSVHNSNAYLTPSPYVPFPKESQASKGRNHPEVENDSSGNKTAEQKDKENMPAPAVPADGQRGKSVVQAKKPKIFTVVLHPTAVSKYADIVITAADSRSNITDSRQDPLTGGPLSATVPPTPSTAILPPTPLTSMAPPAKRLKKAKVELDGSNIHTAESQITLATTAPLILEPVHSAKESAALLDALAHPMHSDKPPSPKTRKRTVAEMEADEALAAEQERYMLILDERLSSSTTGAQGGANPADSDGQAGGASFEPRFERFKAIENIRNSHEEAKKAEKARQLEAERKMAQERERERLRIDAEKRDHEKMRQQNLNLAAVRQQQERRAMAQQMSNQAGGMPQAQGQHAHPNNGQMGNGIQTQPQRFQQTHQVSQAQASSPIVRNGTPLNNSSPSVNNVGNMAMQNSNSSMAGSPPRPSSVVHQNQAPMSATSNGMTTQRSQQSHAGTPRMPNTTPNIQSTPISRPLSQTPRMNQASPPQGPMAQVPMMMNGGHQPINAQQQAAMLAHQQQMRQNVMRQQQQANINSMAMANGQPMTPAQQQQRYMMMQAAVAQGNHMQNPAMMAQNYQQRMAGMGMQQSQGLPPGAMPQNMGFNQGMPVNMANMNMQQIQQIHLQQQAAQQAQQQQQAHIQAAQQAQAQGQGQVQLTPQQMMHMQVQRHTQTLIQTQLPQLQAQYPGGVPQEMLAELKTRCHQNALAVVTSNMRKRQIMAQQQQQQQQNAMAQRNAMQMQNGMGMQGQGM